MRMYQQKIMVEWLVRRIGTFFLDIPSFRRIQDVNITDQMNKMAFTISHDAIDIDSAVLGNSNPISTDTGRWVTNPVA